MSQVRKLVDGSPKYTNSSIYTVVLKEFVTYLIMELTFKYLFSFV